MTETSSGMIGTSRWHDSTASEISPRETIWVALALLAGLVPHMARFPLLLSLAFVGAALWRIVGSLGHMPLPDRRHPMLWIVKQIVAVGAFIAIYVTYRGQLGRDAGVELLAALLGLKLLEMRSPRDYYVVSFLCFFLVVTNFFYSQTMFTALYMLALVIYINMVLIQFNTPTAYRHTSTMARLAGLMTLQAIPLMLAAFVLFPRIPGPLWGLPHDAFDAVSGLSEEMSIGEITRLGLSDAVAFRVDFKGNDPRARDLYWRGPVLWDTDGRTWLSGDAGKGPPGEVERRGPEYHYTVTLEPHRLRWLIGLDAVVSADTNARRTSDYRLAARRKVRRRISYDVTSVVDHRLPEINAEQRRRALALPLDQHPRALKLAAEWRSQHRDARGVANQALDYFRQQPFSYTLTPPALPNDTVDEFLFETRQGFCEHFSAAFVVLMRAAGIPARVVTGYQGGEYNSVSDFMVVRQRDAHAWAEIYIEGDGWVRYDPTGAVAPSRVSLGIESVLNRNNRSGNLAINRMAGDMWSRFGDVLEAVTYNWNRWVLGYTPQQQQYLLEDLGLEDWDYGDLVMALTLSLAVITIMLGVLLLRGNLDSADPAKRAWLLFCARLGRLGLSREVNEPPLAYARRVMRARSDLAQEVSTITRLYTDTRYGKSAHKLAELRRRVHAFRPSGRFSRSG